MSKYSERTATSLASVLPRASRINTIRDFLELLNVTQIQRVQRESPTTYRSKILNDKGSQFTVYTDDGIKAHGQPPSVVKCAKFALGPNSLTLDAETRRIVNSVHRELLALTHQRLRSHPNIIRLLYYDLVEDGDHLAVPALIVERAAYGSLADFLEESQANTITISNEKRRDICVDVTSGLLALHRSEVVHGDVKTENILIFDSSQPGRTFTAKLADFGSIIPIAPLQTEYGRYYGTKLTNAPEVSEQSMGTALDASGLLKCDNYSLGLLLVNVVVGELEEALTFKNLDVLDIALRCVSNSKIGPETKNYNALSRVLEILLPWDPQNRTSDLALVLNLLRPWTFSDMNLTCEKADGRLNETGRSEVEVAKSIEQTFGHADYLNYISADVTWTEEDPQRSIFSELQIAAKSPIRQIAGNAQFQLAIAHAIGFGALVDVEKALELVVDAAKKDYLPAQAVFAAWHVTHERPVPVSLETQLDWLYEATSWGSFYAGNSLQRLSQVDHESARTAFHRKGGYNQYFFSGDPPTHIGSSEFRHSLSSVTVGNDTETVNQLLQSAIIYGDDLLTAQLLLEYSLDPNLTNHFGESLLVLACKGGHIKVLKTLVDAGATAKTRDERGCVIKESGLHWLTAFDEEHIEAALTLLDQAGVGQEQAPEISWNHPSIDLPGNLPSECPLHFAAYFNHATCTEALVNYRPNHINSHGSVNSDEEKESPLEYAIRLRRAMIAQILVDHSAPNDLEANKTCLIGLGEMLSHESWAITGISQLEESDLVQKCIRPFFHKVPSLLDMPDPQGFTPVMIAAENHSVDVVKALILFGCNVNAATPPENDARTALNLLTENHLHYNPDDLIEVLLQAGAQFNHRTSKGGKMLIHYAARDNVAWILERCLGLGASIEATTAFGETPLHCAAFFGSYEVGRVLLERGANMEATQVKGTFTQRDWNGLTPIALAATRLRHAFIEMLLSFGASPLARPHTGHTLLHLAVSEPETKMLEMLLQLPELRSNHILGLRDNIHGMTALHLAAGNLEKCRHARLLLDAGADPALLAPGGWSVLDLAYGVRDLLWKAFFESATHGESFTIPFYAPDNDDAVVAETQPKPESPAIPPPDEIEVVPREKYHESSINGELESWHELIDLLEDRGLQCNQSLPEFPEDMVSLD